MQALSVTSWQLLVYFVGILPSNFYRTILARDLAGFRWVLMKSLLLIGAVTLSIAAYKFLEGWVALGWRSALCNFLHERYLNRTMYYKLNVLDRKVDNPCGSVSPMFLMQRSDQRITSDVDRFTQTFRSMITNLISSPLMIVYYTYLTWHFLGPLGPLYVRLPNSLRRLTGGSVVCILCHRLSREQVVHVAHRAARGAAREARG